MKAGFAPDVAVAEQVKIVDYSPRWPKMYEEDKARILSFIGEPVTGIEHIGSTAIPGLGAKPIIDIMIAIPRLEVVEKCVQPLERIGYEYRGELGIPGRHMFRKPPRNIGPGTHHIHMVEQGSEFWERHLLFRDYLLSHPTVARQYYGLKKELATKFVSNRETYTDSKTSFIESVVERARKPKVVKEG